MPVKITRLQSSTEYEISGTMREVLAEIETILLEYPDMKYMARCLGIRKANDGSFLAKMVRSNEA